MKKKELRNIKIANKPTIEEAYSACKYKASNTIEAM